MVSANTILKSSWLLMLGGFVLRFAMPAEGAWLLTLGIALFLGAVFKRTMLGEGTLLFKLGLFLFFLAFAFGFFMKSWLIPGSLFFQIPAIIMGISFLIIYKDQRKNHSLLAAIILLILMVIIPDIYLIKRWYRGQPEMLQMYLRDYKGD